MNQEKKVVGFLALDIDGTAAADHQPVSPEVCQRLTELIGRGWEIVFITGRTFSYGYEALKTCPFPFTYAVSNGATVLKMPEQKIVRSHYLPASDIFPIEEACQEIDTDCVAHTSVEGGNTCYWRPNQFSKNDQDYLRYRRGLTSEPWVEIEGFEEADLSYFCYAKAFGPWPMLKELEQHLHRRLKVATTVISDPLRPGDAVILITHPLATKGGVIKELRSLVPKVPIVAAGDDYNDLSMLQEADIAIVMDTAPKELKELADIIAPPATEMGILSGIDQALERLHESPN